MSWAVETAAPSLASFSGNALPSPAAYGHSRPASSLSSSSRRDHAPPQPQHSDAAVGWNGSARRSDSSERSGLRLSRRGDEAGAFEGGGALGERSHSASRRDIATTAVSHRPLSSHSSTASPRRPEHRFGTATSAPRPPSSHSITSSAHPPALSSPPTQYTPYTPSAFGSTAESAFDFDALLGPRPAQASSTSPPSSEDDRRRVAAEPQLHGLGFSAGASERPSGELGGTSGELDIDEDEGDESWLHLHRHSSGGVGVSSSSILRAPPTSPPLSQGSPLPTSVPQPGASSSGSGGGGARPTTSFGSPLSPLVAPFSPASTSLGGGQGSPWSGPSSNVGARLGLGLREREASWNSAIGGSSPLPLDARTFAPPAQHPGYPVDLIPSIGSQTSFASPPLADRCLGEQYQSSAYSSQPSHLPFVSHPQHDSVDLPFVSSAPFISAAMSQTDSREGYIPSLLKKEREMPADKGGYVRAAYSERSSYLSMGGSMGGSGNPHTFAAPSASNTPAGAARTGGDRSGGPGSVSGAESIPTEEISTVFVVGFPEDMLEREFQNMFLFADGFEAATLKVPLATVAVREWEKELGGMGGSDAGGAGSLMHPSTTVAYEDSFGNTPLESAANGSNVSLPLPGLPPHLNPALASKDLFGPTREATGSPASVTGAPGSTTSSANTRKQIIGFARFRTRQQAVEAAEMLNGKKVDSEKGSVLKAEMAKKNLHTKRSAAVALGAASPFAAEQPVPFLASGLPSTSMAALVAPSAPAPPAPASAPQGLPAASSPTTMSMPGSGPSIPLSALDSDTLHKLANSGNVNPAVLAEIARQTAAAAAAASSHPVPVQEREKEKDDRLGMSAYDAFHSVPPQGPVSRREYFDDPSSALLDHIHPHSPSSKASASPPRPAGMNLAGAFGGPKSMLQQLDEGVDDLHRALPSLEGPYPRPPTSDLPFPTHPHPLSPPLESIHQPLRERQPSYQPTAGASPYSTFQQPLAQMGGYPSVGLAGIPRTQNPADMNAPKNTLYVGGLPAVLPSLTGPFSASHLEDSLRNAFSRCPGFKRLQFRSKSNGPIVFVEFEDTAYATKAMNELYGHTLGGLVKGGIRLSYSKNPLGVRSNGMPSGNPSSLPGSTQFDPSLHGGYVPYSTSTPPFAGASYDPHRRPPDPIYGATAYPSPHHGGPPPPLGMLDRSPPPLPSAASTTPYGQVGGSTSPSAGQFGSSFSPFGFNG
ncbi:hypothetical protein JCM21900_002543 [Sporobolomyces salmonicolor]